LNSPNQHSAVTDYLAVLGLEREPFLDQVDDRFFYADPILIQRLDLLQHLIRFSDMLLGVIGPSGSGKSTLLRQFKLRGDTGSRRCFVHAAQIQKSSDLLTKLAECLDQGPNAAPDRLAADLLRHLRALQLGAQRVVLVVDDAHLLPEKALSDLLQLAGDARQTLQLMRVVLFSEAGLEQKLAEAGLHIPQQPLIHNLEIPRFDEQQTAAYLMYRLAVAGYSGDSPFSLTEIRALHKAADGLPGRLNVLAHETLMERANRIASRKASASSGSGQPKRRPALIGAVIVGVALLGAASWYFGPWGSRTGSHEPPIVSAIPVPTASPPLPDAPAAAAQAPPASAAPKKEPITNLESHINISDASENKGVSSRDQTTEDDMTRETPATDLPEQEISAQAEPTRSRVGTPTEGAHGPDDGPPAAPVLAEQGEQTAAEPARQPSTADAVVEPTVQPEPAAPVQPQQASRTEASETPATAPSAEAAQQTEGGPATSPAATAVEPAREPWLLARPPDRFALQLLGVRSEASLRGYLARHRPPAPIAYFRTQYKGGEWFVLVQGDYPSMAAARAAVATLPAAIRKGQPWPRSFAAIHADIGNAE